MLDLLFLDVVDLLLGLTAALIADRAAGLACGLAAALAFAASTVFLDALANDNVDMFHRICLPKFRFLHYTNI